MTAPLRMIAGADLPNTALAWYDFGGNLINFSVGWSFLVKLGTESGTTLVTKDDSSVFGFGISPNVQIFWQAGDIASLAPGRYIVEVTATSDEDSRDRKAKFSLIVDKALS